MFRFPFISCRLFLCSFNCFEKMHRVERIDCDEPKLSVTKLIDPSEINLSYRRRSIQPKVGALYRSFRQTILKFSRLCSRLCSDLGINTTFAVEIPPCSEINLWSDFLHICTFFSFRFLVFPFYQDCTYQDCTWSYNPATTKRKLTMQGHAM